MRNDGKTRKWQVTIPVGVPWMVAQGWAVLEEFKACLEGTPGGAGAAMLNLLRVSGDPANPLDRVDAALRGRPVGELLMQTPMHSGTYQWASHTPAGGIFVPAGQGLMVTVVPEDAKLTFVATMTVAEEARAAEHPGPTIAGSMRFTPSRGTVADHRGLLAGNGYHEFTET